MTYSGTDSERACGDLCGGSPAMGIPTAITDVAPKVRDTRRLSLQPRGEDSMTDRNLAETVRHSGGVEVTAR